MGPKQLPRSRQSRWIWRTRLSSLLCGAGCTGGCKCHLHSQCSRSMSPATRLTWSTEYTVPSQPQHQNHHPFKYLYRTSHQLEVAIWTLYCLAQSWMVYPQTQWQLLRGVILFFWSWAEINTSIIAIFTFLLLHHFGDTRIIKLMQCNQIFLI
jgi:hypothetical protein